jgi:hypothetical protein
VQRSDALSEREDLRSRDREACPGHITGGLERPSGADTDRGSVPRFRGSQASHAGGPRMNGMCRNLQPLSLFDPSATDEFHAATVFAAA